MPEPLGLSPTQGPIAPLRALPRKIPLRRYRNCPAARRESRGPSPATQLRAVAPHGSHEPTGRGSVPIGGLRGTRQQECYGLGAVVSPSQKCALSPKRAVSSLETSI